MIDLSVINPFDEYKDLIIDDVWKEDTLKIDNWNEAAEILKNIYILRGEHLQTHHKTKYEVLKNRNGRKPKKRKNKPEKKVRLINRRFTF